MREYIEKINQYAKETLRNITEDKLELEKKKEEIKSLKVLIKSLREENKFLREIVKEIDYKYVSKEHLESRLDNYVTFDDQS